jgi:membrane protein required for colicin V production
MGFMQAYDLIMLVVLAMATIFGAIKGFAWQVASLASIIVSYLVAYNFRTDVAKLIQAAPPWNLFLAMLLLYIGTSFVIWVCFRLVSGVIDGIKLKEFDRQLGAAFGLAKGLIYCLLITMFAMTLLGPRQQEAICQSRSGYYIASALDNATGVLPKELHDVVGPYLARLDAQLQQGQTAGGNPAGGNPAGAGSIWPSGWGGGQGAGQGSGPAEQGGGSGWNLDNFWPSGTAPQAPTGAPSQNFPPLVTPPGGNYGYDPNAAGGMVLPGGWPNGASNPQQAQQPGWNWPR